MPRNGSGTYTLPAGNPVEPNTIIEADWANTTLEDLGNEITNSLSRTGEGGMLAPLRFYDGSSSVPGVAWLNETSSGWYRAGSGEFWTTVLATPVMQYTSAGVMVPSSVSMTVQGNQTVGGTLGVTGNFSVNTDKFTVAASSGNTAVAGTLGVTGLITASGGVSGNITTSSATITGGTINGTTIGASTPSSGAFTSLSASGAFSLTGDQVQVSEGGTGATTAAGARVNILPSYSTNALKFLRVNAGGTDVEWASEPNVGTVTSVNASGGSTGMSFSGGPITSSGTLTLAGTLAVASGGTGSTTASGARTALDVPSTGGSGATGTWGINVSGNAATVTNGVYTSGSYSDPSWITALAGSKITGNISGNAGGLSSTLAVSSGGTGQTSYTNGQLLIGNSTGNTLSKATLTAGTGISITNGNGSITIASTSSGGTVTSVDVSGGTTGLTTSGGPVTGSGTITLDGTLGVANGGTGATTASGARTSLDVPSTSGSGATGTWGINVSGNAATVTNGVYTNGSYADPTWITSLAGSKITGNISGNAAGLTSTLAVSSGGTGLTSTPTNGQIDIGNGSGFTRTTLTAGSGVTITNGAGTITISAPDTGTVTSVSGTGSVNGITLSGTVTSSGSLTLGGTLSGVSLTSQVTGTLPVANGGTGVTTSTGSGNVVLSASPTLTGTLTAAAANFSGALSVLGAATRLQVATNENFRFKDLAGVAFLSVSNDADNANVAARMDAASWAINGAVTLGNALTYGGVTLSNSVTGTGSMVLSASPTLTGTYNAASALLSGTLGVGGVTPSTFGDANTKAAFGVTSTGAADVNVQIGTGNYKSIWYVNDISGNGAGIGTRTNTPFSTLVNGSVITTTNASGLGIGMTPTYKLDVTGGSNTTIARLVAGNGSYGKLDFEVGAGNVGSIKWDNTASANTLTYNTGGGAQIFQIASSEKMRLNSSGYLGIGTTSPPRKLTVSNGGAEGFEFGPGETAGYNYILNYNRNTSAYVINRQYAASYEFLIGGTEKMRLDSNGYLQLGTTTAEGFVTFSKSSPPNGNGLVVTNGVDANVTVKIGSGISGIGNGTSTPFYFCINSSEVARFNTSGVLLVGTTSGDGKLTVDNGTTEGTSVVFFGYGTGGQHRFYNAGNDSSNAAAAAYRIGKNSGTGRSINAGGTINASGADYAEYMTKAGDFTVAKGDVIGVNADGKLTNAFADAVSFVVKSTNPSYVGGDTWGAGFDDDAEGLEQARIRVDRIAFAGQVPVNVLNAVPGQYIVPVNDGGVIKAEAVSNPTFEQYQSAVGKVIAIEDDGRARIIVKTT